MMSIRILGIRIPGIRILGIRIPGIRILGICNPRMEKNTLSKWQKRFLQCWKTKTLEEDH